MADFDEGTWQEKLALAAPEAETTSNATVLHKMRALLAPQYRRRTLILWAAFFLSINEAPGRVCSYLSYPLWHRMLNLRRL